MTGLAANVVLRAMMAVNSLNDNCGNVNSAGSNFGGF